MNITFQNPPADPANPRQPKKKKGCFYGCLLVFILTLVFAAVGLVVCIKGLRGLAGESKAPDWLVENLAAFITRQPAFSNALERVMREVNAKTPAEAAEHVEAPEGEP